MSQLFFNISDKTAEQITEIFDFLWPTATAMWNLRWQVKGYAEAYPEVTIQDLTNRFVFGSKIHGANLKRACIEHTWEQQQQQFAKFLLVNIFAVYESWVKDMLDSLGVSQYDKALQYPTLPNTNNGVIVALSSITQLESLAVKHSIYPSLISNKKYSYAQLNNLMICYRYFKECRNCLVHNNGIADEKLEKAYNAFQLIANKNDLGVNEVPQHSQIVKTQPVQIFLRGVVGFCDVIIRLITTLDAELARTQKAEQEILKRWEIKHSIKSRMLKSDQSARQGQITRLIRNLGFPSPLYSTELENFLKQNKLITY